MSDLNKIMEEAQAKVEAELNTFRLNAIAVLNDVEKALLRARTYPGAYHELERCDAAITHIIGNWNQVEHLTPRYELFGEPAGPKSMADFSMVMDDGICGASPHHHANVSDSRMIKYTGTRDCISPEAFIILRSSILCPTIAYDLQFMLETLSQLIREAAMYYKDNPQY